MLWNGGNHWYPWLDVKVPRWAGFVVNDMIVDANKGAVYSLRKNDRDSNTFAHVTRHRSVNLHQCSKGLATGTKAHDFYRISCNNNKIEKHDWHPVNRNKMTYIPNSIAASDITTNANGTLFAVDMNKKV